MKGYQVYVNGEKVDVPHEHDFTANYIKRKLEVIEKLENVTVKEVAISVGDYYRNSNTLFLKDSVWKGVVKGVYYADNKFRV